MFFKKGLRDSSLICKLAIKNPKTSEAMFAIANMYALAKEATLDTREQKKEKDSGHTDQPSSSKGHDKKRKADHFTNGVEQPRHNKEYWPRSGEFQCFLYCICIFQPRESTRPWTGTDSKVLHMRCSRQPRLPIRRKSPRIPRVTSPKLIRSSTTSMVALSHMSRGGSRNSQPEGHGGQTRHP
jgi:hypothetical protein